MSKCATCKKGILEPKKIDYPFHWGNDVFEFEDIPVKICNECAEIYVAGPMYEFMEHRVRQITKELSH